MSSQLLLDLPIRIFADGADREWIAALSTKPYIKGFTTNPALMRKAGIVDYAKFAREILTIVKEKPISFEVFSDEFPEMRRQALMISKWQENIYVKIPITNSRGDSALPLIAELNAEGVKVNVTAVLTRHQVEGVARAVKTGASCVVSVFAGRVADTGVDPMPLMKESREILGSLPKTELLWASVREVLNIFQAAQCGCHIVTVPHDILAKVEKLGGIDLAKLSLDTVRTFHRDAATAGFKL